MFDDLTVEVYEYVQILCVPRKKVGWFYGWRIWVCPNSVCSVQKCLIILRLKYMIMSTFCVFHAKMWDDFTFEESEYVHILCVPRKNVGWFYGWRIWVCPHSVCSAQKCGMILRLKNLSMSTFCVFRAKMWDDFTVEESEYVQKLGNFTVEESWVCPHSVCSTQNSWVILQLKNRSMSKSWVILRLKNLEYVHILCSAQNRWVILRLKNLSMSKLCVFLKIPWQ
jgi:hypothetical protein